MNPNLWNRFQPNDKCVKEKRLGSNLLKILENLIKNEDFFLFSIYK